MPEENREPCVVLCRICRNFTRHDTLFEGMRTIGTPLDEHVYDGKIYTKRHVGLYECRGCEDITYIEGLYAVEPDVNPSGEPDREHVYPERFVLEHVPRTYRFLSEKMVRIYREVVEAYNYRAGDALRNEEEGRISGITLLCAIGLRSLLEGILRDLGIESGVGPKGMGKSRALEARIDVLRDKGLRAHIVNALHAVRMFGNEAAHELAAPSREHVGKALQIIDDLMNCFYELDYDARELYSGFHGRAIGRGRLRSRVMMMPVHPRILQRMEPSDLRISMSGRERH